MKGLKAVVAGLAFGIASAASAQFGEVAGLGEIMAPGYFKRDILVLSQGLQLDSTQRVIIEALYQDYERDFEAGKNGIKDRFEKLKDQMQAPGIESDQGRLMGLIMQPFRQFGVEKTKLDEEFLENVKALLSDEQLALWPTVERRLYRDKKLPKGQLAGESLDLTVVIRDMHLDEIATQQVQPVLDAYEITLDQALRRREAARGSDQNDMIDAMMMQDTTKQLEAVRKFTALRLGVRNVNDEYIDRVATAMPEDLAAKFRNSALERAYPRVYREHGVQKMFREALALEGLDKSVVEAVRQLESSYLIELGNMNEEIRKVLRENDPKDAMAKASEFTKRLKGEATAEQKADPTRDMFLRRDDISRNYARQLHALLSPEQFGQLTNGNRWVDSPPEVPAQTLHKPTDQSGRERNSNRKSNPDISGGYE